jgi:hypothetical protein
MGSRHPAAGCTFMLCYACGSWVVSGGRDRVKRNHTAASHFMGPRLLPFLAYFLQNKGKVPTSLREGEGHFVVIAKMVVDGKTRDKTKRKPRARHKDCRCPGTMCYITIFPGERMAVSNARTLQRPVQTAPDHFKRQDRSRSQALGLDPKDRDRTGLSITSSRANSREDAGKCWDILY